MSKADNEHAQNKSLNLPSMSFSSVFPPLQTTQTVLKEFPVAERSCRATSNSRLLAYRVSRPVHPVVMRRAASMRTCKKFLGGYF